MSTRIWWFIVFVLFVAIVALSLLLFLTPAPVQAPVTSEGVSASTTGGQTPSPTAPLHESVFVSSPQEGATVGHSFLVVGEAPGSWYFEASFPIKVTGEGGNTIGMAVAQAQGDWMTTELVPFSAAITTDASYTGPATVALLRDNPSGLPENDDSLEIGIVIR
ncbi:MAG: Gmad2 immunoglobulin-like domain-containing protein [Patescibacteria group bacterium]|nr:Gmad2 immunoglobulin-like domain-containing protein [Patescibacteria group bacterium]